MTAPSAVPSTEAIEAARDAVVREHHKGFQAARQALGFLAPLDFGDLSERTQRLKHNQLDPLADAAVAAALPHLTAQLRAEIADEIEAERDLRYPTDMLVGWLNSRRYWTDAANFVRTRR